MNAIETSALTQITRTKVSAPTKFLVDNGCVWGDILHYGEGKAFADRDALATLGEVYSYEPNSKDRNFLPIRSWDFGVANYVLNTLPPESRRDALYDMYYRCSYSYITVRTDKVNGTPFEDGVLTSKGTFQTQLNADQWLEWAHQYLRARIFHKTSWYVILEVW
jgi:hypothetical protein